jgi:type I site-specific restriction endonuclease/uncharacterized protein (DUF433 family)
VQKITGNPNVDRPLQRIREFRNRPNPKIVVTVDMLSTGVDIPALEFIVFLRPVKSRILWEQMLGRGTRRCDEINKSKFVVFDCFDGTLFRYFKDVSNFKIEEPSSNPLTIVEVIENIWQNIDWKYHINVLVKRLHRIDKDMSVDARAEFDNWIPEGNVGKFAAELPKQFRDSFDETMKLLRNPKFQQLLTDYPRAKRVFWVGYDVKDEVSSRKLFGKWEKPEDYLEAFARFVRENVNQFEALRILVSRFEGLISVSESGQLAMRDLIKARLRRIEHDASGLAARLYPFTRLAGSDQPKFVVIDPLVSFGRPTIVGTGITTSILAERYKAGDSMDALADDYGCNRAQVEEAVRCELALAA